MKRFLASLMVTLLLLATLLPAYATGSGGVESMGRLKVSIVDENGEPMEYIDYAVNQGFDNDGSRHFRKDATGVDGVIYFDLPFGDYTLLEFGREDYYRNDPMNITVNSTGIMEINLIGSPFYNTLHVRVKNPEGGPVAGAAMVLYRHSDGNGPSSQTEHTTDSNGELLLDKVKMGYYYTYVKSAAGYLGYDYNGYYVDSNFWSHGEVDEVDIVVEHIEGTAKIISTDSSGAPLHGARYGLYDGQNTFIKELTVGADGTAASGILVYGDYELREIAAPNGYVPLAEPVSFSIVTHLATVGVPVVSERISGSVRVTKTAGNGTPIPGVKFSLYDSADLLLEELTTGADGKALSGSLAKGDYYLTEIEAAAGYAPLTEPIPFSITTHNEIVEKNVVNSAAQATVRVRVSGGGAEPADARNASPGGSVPISGAVLDVHRASDDAILASMNDESGERVFWIQEPARQFSRGQMRASPFSVRHEVSRTAQ